MQHRGVQIVVRDWLLHRLEAEFVARPMTCPPLMPALAINPVCAPGL
jgi:hypothetical protein